MKYSFSAFVSEWKNAGLSTRYFLMAHSLANLLLGLSSVGSVAASIAGQREIQGVLLVAALLFALQAAVTWSALQRRFKVRYFLW